MMLRPRYIIFLLFSSLLFSSEILAQDNLYSHRKEQRRVWRRWRSNRQSYNPYLDKKKKNRESAKAAREINKAEKKIRREKRRQARFSRRRATGGR